LLRPPAETADDSALAFRFHRDVDATELERLDDDDFVFEPTAWDLAMAIGLLFDNDADRVVALDELADAMLVWADDDESERLTDEAVAAIWNDELAREIDRGLRRVAELGDEWEPAATVALQELARVSSRAEVVRAVVQHLAMQLSQADHPPFFCVCCIDELLRETPQRDRRALACRVAIVARRNARLSESELRTALAGAASEQPVRYLATFERREAVRARLGRIGRVAHSSMPALATELEAIGAEPLPERPEDDDVWCKVCELLLAELARPELN
jgi:hypothetical protein